MADEPERKTVQRTSAAIRRSSWPGWIWAVPLAALGIGIWLGVRALTQGGVKVTVVFDDAAGMQPGDTEIKYRGLKIGKVTGVSLSDDGEHVIAKLDIDNSVKKYITSGTRFWLQGSNPSFSDLSSLKSIVAGPTIIMEPGTGKPTRHFVGLDQRPPISESEGHMVRYEMLFDGPVGELKVEAPVKLRGFTVGEVEDIGFHYDAATGAIQTPVTIAIDPKLFHIEDGLQPVRADSAPVMNQVLEQMIKRGMRARLTQDPPVIGSYDVTFDFVAGASQAQLDTTSTIPRIPTASSGSPQSIIDQVNQIPLDQISHRVLHITDEVDDMASSPEIHDSIEHLDRTLASIDKTAHQAGPQITQLVQSLRQTAGQIDVASDAANRLLGGVPAGQESNIRNAVHELTEAARSVRSLADYLDRHPEAVLKGKREG